MVTVGWIILTILVVLFLFGPPWYGNGCSFSYGYWDELRPWLLCWLFSIIATGLIVFGLAAASGSLG